MTFLLRNVKSQYGIMVRSSGFGVVLGWAPEFSTYSLCDLVDENVPSLSLLFCKLGKLNPHHISLVYG